MVSQLLTFHHAVVYLAWTGSAFVQGSCKRAAACGEIGRRNDGASLAHGSHHPVTLPRATPPRAAPLPPTSWAPLLGQEE